MARLRRCGDYPGITGDLFPESVDTSAGICTLRFKEFGDSNITFVVVIRANDVGAQYVLQHEFVKALHRRFKETGIEIFFPVQKLVFEEDRLPQLLATSQRDTQSASSDD